MQNQKMRGYLASTDDTHMLHILCGLKDVRILAVERLNTTIITIELLLTAKRRLCPTCHATCVIKDRPVVMVHDLPAFQFPAQLRFKKHRLQCTNPSCTVTTFTLNDSRIVARRSSVSTRCAKYLTREVGTGTTIATLASDIGCSWNTVNTIVTRYGKALLAADTTRVKHTRAMGLDEISFRKPRQQPREWCTTVTGVDSYQLIDILPTRTAASVATYLRNMPPAFKRSVAYGTLDMSSLYSAIYTVALPHVTQVVDPFHVVKLANANLDDVRRRVQLATWGSKAKRTAPLYRARRKLLTGEERLSPSARELLETLLALGDPDGEVAFAHRIKEAIRDFYDRTASYDHAAELFAGIVHHLGSPGTPPELRRFGRTLQQWKDRILAWHTCHFSNGKTEAANRTIKLMKKIGYGFTNFENFRVRALLFAGHPTWKLLDSIRIA